MEIKLSDYQKRFLESNSKCKVIIGGCRSGKTYITIKKLVDDIRSDNRSKINLLIVSSSRNMSHYELSEIKKQLSPLDFDKLNIEFFDDKKTEVDFTFIDYIVATEFLYIKPFNELLKIVEEKTNDTTIMYFEGTPRAYSYTNFTLFSAKVIAEVFRCNVWDNPIMALKREEIQKNGKTYEENLIMRMPIERYVQDYLGKFVI